MSTKPIDNNPDHIIEDEKSLAIKDKVLARQKNSSLLNAISQVTMFAGTMFTTIGAGMGVHAITAGIALLSTPALLPIVAIGAAFLLTGVITNYAQSRIWQSCTFDNLEANADSTARHLVKELQAHNMCMGHEQEESPSAHKQWTTHIETQRQQEPTIATVRA